MNDQLMAALKAARQARNDANLRRFDPALSAAERGQATKLYLDLDDLEGKLILDDVRAQLDGLKQDSAALQAIVDQLRAAKGALDSLADKVQFAATALNALVAVAQGATAVKILPTV